MDDSSASVRQAPVCEMRPRPRILQALLSLAWRHPRSERPSWLRAEVGASLADPPS